jgi:uncharacterized protein
MALDTQTIKRLTMTLSMDEARIITVLDLLKDNTVPFIARYRKEMTGSMDEETIRSIAETYEYQKNLEERKLAVIRLIDEKGLLTKDLEDKIKTAKKLVDVEDLYRPFKEKKKTKATKAIKLGLEPLANAILKFNNRMPEKLAEAYLSEDVQTVEDALQGARDIIAEKVSDEATYRKWIRDFTFETGSIVSKLKKKGADSEGVYAMYHEFFEPIKRSKAFRILAMNRGEKEKALSVKIDVESEKIVNFLTSRVIKNPAATEASQVTMAIEDGYKRLIKPSIERDIRKELFEDAEIKAIDLFSENLKNLLLQPPLNNKKILGVDPAYRTGCKLAVLDEIGTLKSTDVIYPHTHANKDGHHQPSKDKLQKLINSHKIDVIAIGNGTASRETEALIAEVIKESTRHVVYTIVDEAGASVYSASKLAKQEFPHLNVEHRSAVSIARRLLDPLSELVKIDPKSIGVGQYQHDLSQKKLNEALTFTVETVVNRVGVDVNVASASLLQYVSGISNRVSENIVEMRESKGAFKNRKELREIAGMGAKTFEQSIGFLRIIGGNNPLDKTPIHPESYNVAKNILTRFNLSLEDVGTKSLRESITHVNIDTLVSEMEVGKPTLKDILDSLESPLRDPRDEAPAPILKSDVLSLEDLKEGMALKGTVRNVVDFGAFVDCGVKEDGLVHISKLKKRFVKHPMDVVSVGDVVDVWVEGIDIKRKRLQLSMVDPTNKR